MCSFNLSQSKSRYGSLFNLFFLSLYSDNIEEAESPIGQILIRKEYCSLCSSLIMIRDLVFGHRSFCFDAETNLYI